MPRNGQTLRDLRGARTLKQIEARTGVSAGHLSRVERAETGMGRKLWAALLKCYRVSAAVLERAERATARQYRTK